MEQQIPDNWQRGDLYERYVGRWSRQVAPKFLSWLELPTARRWLDVGCGTGALSESILDNCSPKSVTGIEPSAGFLAKAKQTLGDQANFIQCTSTEIPLARSSVDVTVSGLVLNFVPDLPTALVEMARVTKGGGTVGAYVWDYQEKMEFMRIFWDTAIELDPSAAKMDEGFRFPLCNPKPLAELFSKAGLKRIELTAIEIPTLFENFDDYWQPFLGGQGSAPSYVMTLDAGSKVELRERLRERIPTKEDGAISLVARAWAIRATVAK